MSVDRFSLVGQVVDGQFRVESVLGEGGFSVVYRGHHLALDAPIAIKCLKVPAGLPSTVVETFVRRFREESRLLYRLSQGNLSIVRSVASGTLVAERTGALVPYMVLEWLDGVSLEADLEARQASGTPGRTLAEVLELLKPVAEALAYAHEQGIVHRDLNPGNVFLARGSDGVVRTKVLDFGLAKVVGETMANRRSQTFVGVRVFSPTHAAPEQFDPSLGDVGMATDVYSFAVLVSETILGRSTIEGSSIAELRQKVFDASLKRSPGALGANVSTQVEEVFVRAMALHPRDRHSDVAAFWKALLRAAGRSSTLETFRMPSERPPPSSRTGTVRLATPTPPPVGETRDATERMPARNDVTAPMPASAARSATAPMASVRSEAKRSSRPAPSRGADPDPEEPKVELEPGIPTVHDASAALDPSTTKPTVLVRRRSDGAATAAEPSKLAPWTIAAVVLGAIALLVLLVLAVQR